MRNRRWLAMGLAVLIGGAAVLPGCNKADAKLQIAYIAKNTGNVYFDPLIQGVRDAANDAGADFTTNSPASADDPTGQLQMIKDDVQKGVKVLLISPNSPDALNVALRDAMSKGVTVITVDSDVTGHEDARNAAVLPVDTEGVGKAQVELMGSLIDYQGQIAILSATTDAPNQNAWIAVMKKTLTTDPKYARMQLMEVAYGNDDPAKSLTEAEALLSKYPELRGIIAPTTVGIVAAAQCVASKNKASQVQVTGLGTPSGMRQFIKDGTVKAFQLWSPYDEGHLAGTLGLQIAAGKLKLENGTKFEAGKLGEKQIGDKDVVITGPPLTFTAKNIDDFKF